MSAQPNLTVVADALPASPADPLPLAISGPQYTITATGLVIHGELSDKEWVTLGEQLGDVERCLGFLIGDWINYANARWGERYNDAIAATGLEYSLLRKYAYVARRVPPANRMWNLPFSHHETVAKVKDLAKQREWLELALEHDLGVRRLRKSMNFGRLATEQETEGDPNDRGHVTYLALLNRIRRWWYQNIDAEPLEEWDEEQRENLAHDFGVINRIYERLRSTLSEEAKRDIDRSIMHWRI